MENLPSYVNIAFLGCVVAAFGFIYYAVTIASSDKSPVPVFVVTLLGVWIFVVSLLALQDFFLNFEWFPPRLMLGLVILILSMIVLFSVPASRDFIGRMPITTLTYLHIIRVPVEIVLWWLYTYGLVAEAMTFDGLNYDIISGISAPFAGLFLVGMKSKSRFAAIIWNLLALALLFNIVSRAIMLSPYFYEAGSTDQLPNIAVFYFPFVLLPLFVVPAVLFCHLASLYQLFFVFDEDEK